MDSIEINLNQYPYYFHCRALQKIIRPTSIVTRNLVTEGYLRNVSRSDNNSHGFLIERYEAKLKRYAYRFFREKDDITDTVQDVFIKAMSRF